MSVVFELDRFLVAGTGLPVRPPNINLINPPPLVFDYFESTLTVLPYDPDQRLDRQITERREIKDLIKRARKLRVCLSSETKEISFNFASISDLGNGMMIFYS